MSVCCTWYIPLYCINRAKEADRWKKAFDFAGAPSTAVCGLRLTVVDRKMGTTAVANLSGFSCLLQDRYTSCVRVFLVCVLIEVYRFVFCACGHRGQNLLDSGSCVLRRRVLSCGRMPGTVGVAVLRCNDGAIPRVRHALILVGSAFSFLFLGRFRTLVWYCKTSRLSSRTNTPGLGPAVPPTTDPYAC